VSKLPLARVIDTIGRLEGLLIMLCFVVICETLPTITLRPLTPPALILIASCSNVETYTAAQVFFWTGMNSIGYVLKIFLADTTTLKNRIILFGFSTTPYIANTFAGPAASQAFLEGST
jgi:hypothetical protein